MANLCPSCPDWPKPSVSYQKQYGYTKMALLVQTTFVHNSCTSRHTTPAARPVAPKLTPTRRSASENNPKWPTSAENHPDSPKPTASYIKQMGSKKMAPLLQPIFLHNPCTNLHTRHDKSATRSFSSCRRAMSAQLPALSSFRYAFQ